MVRAFQKGDTEIDLNDETLLAKQRLREIEGQVNGTANARNS